VYLIEVARGYLALGTGDKRSARYHFALASDQRPAQVSVLETLLRLELEEGTLPQALLYARSLLVADPSNSFGYYVIGTYQVEGKRYAEAEVTLRKSLSIVRTPEALNNLAWILQAQGRFEEAENLAMEGLRLQNDSSSLWDTLGVTVTRAGRAADAIGPLSRAVELAPSDPDPLVHLAEAVMATGNGARAVELCDAALRLTNPRAADSIRTIKKLRRRAANLRQGGTNDGL
jgi:tetratricopeptide (TPR) repeat protein